MANILVVDDYSDTVESMAMWLKHFGHDVQVARDGYQAVAIAHRQRPNYVLLDLGLPGLDGYQVASRLRRELAAPPSLLPLPVMAGRRIDNEHWRPGATTIFSSHSTIVLWSRCFPRRKPGQIRSPRGTFTRGERHSRDLYPSGRATRRCHQRSRSPSSGRRQVCQARPSVPSRRPGCVQRSQGERPEHPRPDDARRECGTQLELEADGPDAKLALDALTDLISRGFDEHE